MIDHSEAGSRENVRRQSEIDNVEHVEEFCPKLQFCGFAVQGCLLHQRDVEVAKSRSSKGVAAEGSEAPLVRSGPARDVDGDRIQRNVISGQR